MKLIEIQCRDADRLAPLVADFRVTLNRYRGIASQPRVEAAREEIGEFLDAGSPIFAVEDGGELAGYTSRTLVLAFAATLFAEKAPVFFSQEMAERVLGSVPDAVFFTGLPEDIVWELPLGMMIREHLADE